VIDFHCDWGLENGARIVADATLGTASAVMEVMNVM
jgi:hypothetical protein